VISIAYSGTSSPSAHRLAEVSPEVELVRDSSAEVDVNWGRADANAKLNRDTSKATNKRVMRELFREHGVPMPTLYDVDEVQVPAIGRPDRHTRGKALWLCENDGAVKAALRGTPRKRAASHFMEYVSKERAPREFRVHVFLGNVIRTSLKSYDAAAQEAGRHYTTVSAEGFRTDHVRDAARKAIKAVGLDFGAVDVLANDDECWVLEANCAPGLGGTMPEVYANAFASWKECAA